MIAAWMLYLALVSTLLALAAWGVEAILRARRVPTRWAWVGAAAGTLALPLLAPWVPRLSAFFARGGAAGDGARLTEVLLAAGNGEAGSTSALAGSAAPPWLGPLLVLLWIAATLVVAATFTYTHLRLGRQLRGWRDTRMGNATVRLSNGFGPAVVGVLRPAVVIPASLAARGGSALRLALAHEAEHVRARDPLALAAGSVFVAALPFCPAAWWVLRRLRTAVEVDCDARVLGSGADRRAYARLLLSTTTGGHDLPVAVPALLHTRSALETRIRAMSDLPRPARLRAVLAACASLALVLAACEARSPLNEGPRPQEALAEDGGQAVGETAVGVNATEDPAEATAAGADDLMDVSIAAVQDGELGIRAEGITVNGPDAVLLRDRDVTVLTADQVNLRRIQEQGPAPMVIVDGVIMASPAGVDLEALDIVSVEVVKGAAAAQLYGSRAANGVINVTTRAGAVRRGLEPPSRKPATELPRMPTDRPRVSARGPQPMIIVDGVIAGADVDLEALDIASVDVVKGAAAAKLYGSRGANGVIVVTTKGR